jgi:hypothetical protein
MLPATSPEVFVAKNRSNVSAREESAAVVISLAEHTDGRPA